MTTETWIGDKAYVSSFTQPVPDMPVLHSFELREIFDKKRVANQIGELMIAEGCIKVDSHWNVDTMVHQYYFIARPFSKEKRLPA